MFTFNLKLFSTVAFQSRVLHSIIVTTDPSLVVINVPLGRTIHYDCCTPLVLPLLRVNGTCNVNNISCRKHCNICQLGHSNESADQTVYRLPPETTHFIVSFPSARHLTQAVTLSDGFLLLSIVHKVITKTHVFCSCPLGSQTTE